MAEKSDSFKIVYNSDLIIRDQSEAATLCVFYDQVLLPHAGKTSSLYPVTNEPEKRDLVDAVPLSPLGYEHVIRDWEQLYGTLFDEGVLARLPPIEPHNPSVKTWEKFEFYEMPKPLFGYRFVGLEPDNLRGDLPWGAVLPGDKVVFTEKLRGRAEEFPHKPEKKKITCNVNHTIVERKVQRRRELNYVVEPATLNSILSLPIYTQVGSGGTPYVSDDLIIHLLRTDIELPQIFTTLNGRPGRDVLIALEAEATFSYLLPKLRLRHPTQILELREKTADTREGFSMHLWTLSKGLAEHTNENVPVKEIARFANDMIRRELIPDFLEFRRQLEAMKADKWNKVLDAAGKVAEIDAAPWTPKFWALLLKALGITLVTSAAEQKEMLSNKYQAFKFMGDLKETASRFNV